MRQYRFTVGVQKDGQSEEVFDVWATDYKKASAKVRRITGRKKSWVSGGVESREVVKGAHAEVQPAWPELGPEKEE